MTQPKKTQREIEADDEAQKGWAWAFDHLKCTEPAICYEYGVRAGFKLGWDAHEKYAAGLVEALEYYANKENWKRILGHEQWASTLKELDCELFNTGGGRARLALTEYRRAVGEV